MKPKKHILLNGLFVAAAMALASSAKAQQITGTPGTPWLPNVLIVLTDDAGFGVPDTRREREET